MKTALVLSLSLGLVACGSTPQEREDGAVADPVSVSVGQVTLAPVAASYEAGGVLVSRQTAVLSSRVMAPITRVLVTPGTRVRRGQTVIELDATEMVAQAARAKATMESARAAAVAAASGKASADAALALAKATQQRMATLHAERSATTQELDQAVAGLRAAEAQVAVAIAQAEAADRSVEAAQAGARAADAALSWNTLVAPFDGLVSARHADPGSMAAPGQPLITIEADGALQMEVRLDATRAADVSVGASADVRLDGDAIWTSGKVSEVARVDPLSHSFIVTLESEFGAAARSGLFGRARFAGAAQTVLTVPAEAVVTRGQLTFVYVVGDDSHARLRAVSLGETGTTVLAGLSDGDRVVLRPSDALTDGALVRVGASATPEGVRP